MTDQVNQPSKLVTRLQSVSRNGNGIFGELCGQAAAEILRLTNELTMTYQSEANAFRNRDSAIAENEHLRARTEFKENLTAEIQRLTAENESTRQSLHPVTAAYDKLLKRMGAVREAIGTEPHFEATDNKTWRCFFCDEVFLSYEQARLHFGGDQHDSPACAYREPGEHHLLTALRKAHEELVQYRAEDSDVLRAMYSQRGEHEQALRREEEKGYAKALVDVQWSELQKEITGAAEYIESSVLARPGPYVPQIAALLKRADRIKAGGG